MTLDETGSRLGPFDDDTMDGVFQKAKVCARGRPFNSIVSAKALPSDVVKSEARAAVPFNVPATMLVLLATSSRVPAIVLPFERKASRLAFAQAGDRRGPSTGEAPRTMLPMLRFSHTSMRQNRARSRLFHLRFLASVRKGLS